MADENVVILGARGMLGSDVTAAFESCNISFTALDLPEFDITNDNDLIAAVKNAAAIVNCAAYTNVERAESEPLPAYRINADAVGRLGTFAKTAGLWVLQISTDFVFDGQLDRPYNEEDKPTPVNTYGRSKLAGEQLLVESGCQNCIMRTQWTYGRYGNNFVKKFIAAAKQKNRLRVVDDQTGSPTATTQAARAICSLVRNRTAGIFHFASAGYVSRYEMAKFIVEKLNLDVEVESCKSSEYKTEAKRPLSSRFDCSKIQKLLTEPIKPWQQPLENFLRKNQHKSC